METLAPVSERPLDVENIPDVWNFYTLEYGHRLPCNSIRRFLMLLLSEKVRRIERDKGSEADTLGVYFYLDGPVTDDEECLYVGKRVSKQEIESLTEEERAAFKKRLLDLRVVEKTPGGLYAKDVAGVKTKDVMMRLGLRQTA